MRIFGLIGYPLSHSFSESYFKQKFENETIQDCIYQNFPIKNIDEIVEIINKYENLLGLNVTSPFKQSVIPFVDEIDLLAAHVNSVNVIKIQKHSVKTILKGYNTDVFGFKKSLSEQLETKPLSALILGTGGAAHAVAYVLNEMNIAYSFVSRTKGETKKDVLAYSQLNKEIIRNSRLIINTSPLGLYPDVNNKPDIPFQYLTDKHILFDLIYNPEETLFLKLGKIHGAKTVNGYDMLIYQAEKSWEIFNK